MAFDLFISYSRLDDLDGSITEFIERLNREFEKIHGRKLTFFGTAAVEEWPRRILPALRESRLFLACVTPAYLDSERCGLELREYLKCEIARWLAGEGIAVVLWSNLLLGRETKPDQVFPEPFKELRHRSLFDLRDGLGHDDSLRRLAVQLAHLIRLIERSEDSPGNVDPFNPHFVGRHDELQQIHEGLASERLCVLSGPRGIGKTAIATEYAHAFAREYGGGRWRVSCKGRKSLPAVIETLAPALSLSFGARSEFPAVLRELHQRAIASETKRCLLILDDVTAPQLLAERYVKRLLAAHSDWLHVIVTTRQEEKDFGLSAYRREFLTIDRLPDADVFRLIESFQPGLTFGSHEDFKAARLLVNYFSGLQLGSVAKAASFRHWDDLLLMWEPAAFSLNDRILYKADLGIGKKESVVISDKEVIASRPPLDDNVMFTVYRRKTIAPNKWYPLLAFAHLSERRPDAPADEPDPLVEVQRQAQAVLGGAIAAFKQSTEDSSQPIPISGELMFKPSIPGIEFNPPGRSFKWEEPVHREEFKMRAGREMEGQVARGCLRVWLGPIIAAEVNLAIKVDSNASVADLATDLTDHARPFRRVFASYSHKDKAIVRRIEKLAHDTHLGLVYLRDVTKLRSGDVWDPALLQMIDTADLFQLFWSTNSMCSDYVKREYEHALARQLPGFVRPVYWEKPFPERPEEGLPPDELRRLHFEELSFTGVMPVARKRTDPAKKKQSRRSAKRKIMYRSERFKEVQDLECMLHEESARRRAEERTLREDEELGARLSKEIRVKRRRYIDEGFIRPSYYREARRLRSFPLSAFTLVVSFITALLFIVLKYFGVVHSLIPILLCSIIFLLSLIIFVIRLIRD